MQSTHVYVLTWCKRIELLYGSTLVFKTLREGFPNAQLHVVDAASIPAGRAEIRRLADVCHAQFVQLDRRIELSAFIEQIVRSQPSGAAVFVDPDICFWEKVENWQFAGLAAGRLIPRHLCEFSNCLSEPRLHTSFLWFPEVARIRAALAQARQTYRYFEPFRNIMIPSAAGYVYYDTAAGLYGAFPSQMQAFEEPHLDAYDHLFAGTYADSVLGRLGRDSGSAYRDLHRAAQQDYRTIKGCWRWQQRYFESRVAALEAARQPGGFQQIATA